MSPEHPQLCQDFSLNPGLSLPLTPSALLVLSHNRHRRGSAPEPNILLGGSRNCSWMETGAHQRQVSHSARFLEKIVRCKFSTDTSREAMSQGGFWASTAMRGTARAGLELAFPSPPRFLSFLPCKEIGPKKQNTPEC